jgi:hypothetical protein
LISTLLTIIIPCKDSVYELKSTIENIAKQTRISSTRILVLDMGSKDGSFQYADQASVEHGKILKIESINYDPDKILELMHNIRTLYTMVVLPGTNFKSSDFILDNLNDILSNENILLFSEKNKIMDRIFSNKRLKEGKIKISAELSSKNYLNSSEFIEENGHISILIDKGTIDNNIKIIGGRLSYFSK